MDINLKKLYTLLIKRIWLIVLTCIMVGVISFIFSAFVLEPQYSASSQLYVQNSNGEAINNSVNLSDIQTSQRLAETYMVVLKNREFLEKVINQSGLNYTAAELKNMIAISPVNKTEIFEITVTSNFPSDSANLANTIAELADREIMLKLKVGSVNIIEEAIVPTSPSSPNILQNTIIGLIVGLVAGLGLVILLEFINTKIRDENDLIENFNFPVLGTIPEFDD